MRAFAIYDKKNKEIFISRNRYGIKPFYYYMDSSCFIFASEIPSLLEVLPYKPEPNYQAIFDYLVFNRTDHTEDTFFQPIKKLQHGHCMKVSCNRLSITSVNTRNKISSNVIVKRWYNLRERINQAKGFQSPEEFKEIFSSSVALRLRSDVPVGVCLSGGLDSSSIVSVLLHDYHKKDIHTFSAVYAKGQFGDESEFIQEYTPLIENMHFTTPSAETLFNDLESFVIAHGEPVPSTSPYAQFKVMELAKNYVVVTLNGQGADEELAGYHYFYGLFFKGLLRQIRLFKLSSINNLYYQLIKKYCPQLNYIKNAKGYYPVFVNKYTSFAGLLLAALMKKYASKKRFPFDPVEDKTFIQIELEKILDSNFEIFDKGSIEQIIKQKENCKGPDILEYFKLIQTHWFLNFQHKK